jgi:hypothetical protein
MDKTEALPDVSGWLTVNHGLAVLALRVPHLVPDEAVDREVADWINARLTPEADCPAGQAYRNRLQARAAGVAAWAAAADEEQELLARHTRAVEAGGNYEATLKVAKALGQCRERTQLIAQDLVESHDALLAASNAAQQETEREPAPLVTQRQHELQAELTTLGREAYGQGLGAERLAQAVHCFRQLQAINTSTYGRFVRRLPPCPGPWAPPETLPARPPAPTTPSALTSSDILKMLPPNLGVCCGQSRVRYHWDKPGGRVILDCIVCGSELVLPVEVFQHRTDPARTAALIRAVPPPRRPAGQFTDEGGQRLDWEPGIGLVARRGTGEMGPTRRQPAAAGP